MNFRGLNLKTEAFKMLRFGMVGGTATTTYILLVILLSKVTDLHPIVINTLSYMTGFMISVTGHSLFTFRLTSGFRQAAGKFLVVSITSMLFSNTILFFSLKFFSVPVAQALAISVIPGYSFTLSRFWAFKGQT